MKRPPSDPEHSARTLEERIASAVGETIEIVPYSRDWPEQYALEARKLRRVLAPHLRRIEHFGSTAIPGVAAKPVIDILVEVASAAVATRIAAPRLALRGYEYFWRTDVAVPYAWFIKRDVHGRRSHHIHMVTADSPIWEQLLFRDFLREHPDEARRYEQLKLALAGRHRNDREAYTRGKGAFVDAIITGARARDAAT